MKNKGYAKFSEANKVRYGKCGSGVYCIFFKKASLPSLS